MPCGVTILSEISIPTSSHTDAAKLILGQTTHRPKIGLILGSGMGEFADAIENPLVIETHDVPGWPRSTVEGHKGRILIGTLEGKTVLTLQGRVHFYEGYAIQQVAFPVRVMHALGIKTLIVTNAAGGLNQSYAAGDLMLLSDHINFPGMAGNNPLIGPNDPTIGVRFPDMTTAYDIGLRQLAKQVAAKAGFTLREGVYACVSGPSYETPAEVRMLRAFADAVGMSTAPEVIVARQAGMRVMGVSGISNVAHDVADPSLKVTHEEVMDIGKKLVPSLTALLRGVLRELTDSD